MVSEQQKPYLGVLLGILIIALFVATVVFAVNQASESAKVATQRVALEQCMEFGIPDALYHENKVYCVELRGWIDFQRTMHFFRKATPIEEIRKAFE